MCKFLELEGQEEFLRESRADDAHWWRAYVIHRRKVGGEAVGAETRLGRAELLWFLESYSGQLDRPAIHAHLRTLFER